MSDLGKQLRSFLLADSAISSVVGEKVIEDRIPELDETPYVWFQQSGEEASDALNCEYIESTSYSIEVFSDTIEQTRTLTQAVKDRIREVIRTTSQFEGDVEFAEITSADDDYIPKSVDADDGTHIGALFVELHHPVGYTG